MSEQRQELIKEKVETVTDTAASVWDVLDLKAVSYLESLLEKLPILTGPRSQLQEKVLIVRQFRYFCFLSIYDGTVFFLL